MKLETGCAVSIINENILNERQHKNTRIFIVQTKPFCLRLPMWFSEPQLIPYQKLIHLSKKGWNISHKAWRKKEEKTSKTKETHASECLKSVAHLGQSQNNCQLGLILVISFPGGVGFEGLSVYVWSFFGVQFYLLVFCYLKTQLDYSMSWAAERVIYCHSYGKHNCYSSPL